MGFPDGSAVRIHLQCRRHRFDPWVRKMPWRKRNGNPLQYSCLENPMDRGAWQARVHGVTKVKHDLATKQQQPTSCHYFHTC